MDGEQFVQDCCRLSVAVGASPFGRLIAQFVTAAREPALERRHGTTTGSVASAGKQAWTRQQDAAEEGVNPTQDPVLDAKPAAAAGTGACQFDDLRRLGVCPSNRSAKLLVGKFSRISGHGEDLS